MGDKEPVATWTEEAGSLRVEFPAQPGTKNVGCGWVLLALASLFAISLPVLIVGLLLDHMEVEWTGVLALIAAEAVIGWLWWKCFRSIREPNMTPQPSALTIRDGILKIERAGPDSDLDVSWELKEIADIRLCKTADYGRILLAIASLLLMLFFPPRGPMVRISVMLPNGAVDDTIVPAPAGPWIDDIEQRLRHDLGLANGNAATNFTNGHE